MPGATHPDPLAALAARPSVAAAVDRARQACTELRWHPALRRRTAEVRTEACVRAAAASAELEGVRLPLAQVRAMVGAGSPDGFPDPVDPVDAVVRGALRATLDGHDLARGLTRAPGQALARLHALAATELVGTGGRDTVGRPRPEAAARVGALVRLLAGGSGAPGLVLAAVAEAEVTTTDAFTPAAGVVGRALSRTVVVGSGLDPHGVVVPERHGLADRPGREAALTGYASGAPEGVEAWVVWFGEAVVAGAQQGRQVADEVLAGRLA